MSKIKAIKVYNPDRWLKAWLCLRLAYDYLLNRQPKIVFSAVGYKGTCYLCVNIPYREKDRTLFALPYTASIYKEFGHKFIEIALNEDLWNGITEGELWSDS